MSKQVIRFDKNSSEHRDVLSSLYVEYSAEANATIHPEVVHQLCERHEFLAYLCFKDYRPAGFATCFESFSTYKSKVVVNIHDLMISGTFRGQKLGPFLLQGLIEDCQSRDVLKVTLEVKKGNTAARNLYSSFGFEDTEVKLPELHHWQKYL